MHFNTCRTCIHQHALLHALTLYSNSFNMCMLYLVVNPQVSYAVCIPSHAITIAFYNRRMVRMAFYQRYSHSHLLMHQYHFMHLTHAITSTHCIQNRQLILCVSYSPCYESPSSIVRIQSRAIIIMYHASLPVYIASCILTHAVLVFTSMHCFMH